MLADVVDVTHLARVGVDPPLTVLNHRIVVPRSLPQFVEHIEVFISDLITMVMHHLGVMPEIACGVGQVRRDDVPANPALGQMIEGTHASGEGKRRLVGGGKGRTKAQVARDRRHGRNHQQRIIAGNLHGFAQRGFRAVAKTIIGSDHIGEEHAVKGAVLQQLSQFGPVIQVVEAMPIVLGMHPQAMDDVAHAIHFKQVDVQLLGHCEHSSVIVFSLWRQIATCR